MYLESVKMNTTPMQNATELRLLTGRPGSGKTTLLGKLIGHIPEDKRCGFITEEVLDTNTPPQRIGFQLVSLQTGERLWLARRTYTETENTLKFGNWTVFPDNLQHFMDTHMTEIAPGTTFILDEIGPMQCLSDAFREATEKLIAGRFDGNYAVLATIKRDDCHIDHLDAFINHTKRTPGARLFEIEPSNRDTLFEILKY